MTQFLVVLVTCPTQRHATRLAKTLLKSRLAACVNIIPTVRSLFWWQGKVDQAHESLLIIKTMARQYASLRRTVRAHHPYEVPEIIGLPITNAHRPYLAWIRDALLVSRRS